MQRWEFFTNYPNISAYICIKRIIFSLYLSIVGHVMAKCTLSYRILFRMDYLDMSHLVGDERYHDRLTYDGLWENNLYQFFRIVSPKVQFDLPRPFKLEKGGKRNDDTPQHEAVREAFTNALSTAT